MTFKSCGYAIGSNAYLKEVSKRLLHRKGRHLMNFAGMLRQIGINEETIAEVIRLGNDRVPVFGQQLKGVYLKGVERYAHFAVPGWYWIESVTGNTIRMRSDKIGSDPFETSCYQLQAVLAANLECVEDGLNP